MLLRFPIINNSTDISSLAFSAAESSGDGMAEKSGAGSGSGSGYSSKEKWPFSFTFRYGWTMDDEDAKKGLDKKTVSIGEGDFYHPRNITIVSG